MKSGGFPPVATGESRLLILGTLPGPESLRQRQYYAHERNAFWRIVGALFGAGPDVPYERRLMILKEGRVALWDVCASADRQGALDAAIRRDSMVTNDFAAFFRAHRRIRVVCCNGKKAAELYRRRVLPTLPEALRQLRLEILPSTSPAYATMSPKEKLDRWEIVGREASK